jgi:hypothetical protein
MCGNADDVIDVEHAALNLPGARDLGAQPTLSRALRGEFSSFSKLIGFSLKS